MWTWSGTAPDLHMSATFAFPRLSRPHDKSNFHILVAPEVLSLECSQGHLVGHCEKLGSIQQGSSSTRDNLEELTCLARLLPRTPQPGAQVLPGHSEEPPCLPQL